MRSHLHGPRPWYFYVINFVWLALGAFLAAVGIKVLLAPNNLIDGGVVGIAMIGSYLFGANYLPFFYIILNFPFLFLAYRLIGKTFVIQMCLAVIMFAGFAAFLDSAPPFTARALKSSSSVVWSWGRVLDLSFVKGLPWMARKSSRSSSIAEKALP